MDLKKALQPFITGAAGVAGGSDAAGSAQAQQAQLAQIGPLQSATYAPNRISRYTHTLTIREVRNGLVVSIGDVIRVVGADSVLAEEIAAAWTEYKLSEEARDGGR